MKDEELIPNLKKGGHPKTDALGLIFQHEKIRKAVAYKLNPFRERMENHFPRTSGTAGRPGNYDQHDTLVGHFLTEAIIVLEKNIRRTTFRGDTFAELKSFIANTSKNKCIEWLRKHRPTEQVEESTAIERDLEKWVMDKDRKQQLLNLLDQLGKNCKTIILLDAYGYKNAEIAEQLKKDTNYVKSIKTRCKSRLDDLIQKYIDLK